MVSSFSPTPAELNLVSQIFAQADPGKLGVVTGDAAVKLFSAAKLQPTVLGEIWAIADEENNGWLSKKGVAIAVRLIGHAQKGENVTAALVNKPGPIASIDGLTSVVSHPTGMSMPRSPPPLALPPFTPQDKAKFQRMFQNSGPINGLLSGDKARDIFVKSKLSVDKLSQIWNLADTQDRGSLDVTDFSLGMYFIQACMSGQLSFVPTSLPPGLYEQAGGIPRQHTGVTSHATGSTSPALSSAFSSQIHPQYTGQSALSSSAHTRTAPSAVGASAFGVFRGTGNNQALGWDITAAEKTSADRLFDGLDSQRVGYIEGDIAVPFMLESKLPGDDLAQIWDLADINGDGRLTRDCFAVAMHLIQGKITGKPIPASLPPSLIPPSMRGGVSAAPSAAAPAHSKPIEDLLWGDDSPPASANPTTTTFTPPIPQQYTGTLSSFPPSASRTQPSHDPFGSSSFTASSPSHDLLGDDNEVASPPLHDQSAEIGNTQNQLNSTNRSLETAKADRANMESQLASQAAQLSQLQTQLSSAKAAYETESKLASTLRERFSTQTTEMQRLREDLIRHESDLSAARVEKAEIEGQFLRDKEEVRGLQRRMLETGQQIEMTKAEAEKLKKEAKQQKGLLAIAKKQLSTKETENSRLDKEVEELKIEVQTVTKEKEEAEAELEKASTMQRSLSSDILAMAVTQPLPLSPELTGTTSPGSKSNNPFGRLTTMSNHSSPRPISVFLPFADTAVPTPTGVVPQQQQQDTNDDPFGFTQPAAKTEPTKNDDLFGFNDAFGADAAEPSSVPTNDVPASGLETPKRAVESSPIDNLATSPTSASETEHFTTPPATAQGYSPEPSSRFPAIEESTVPGHFPLSDSESGHARGTDLGAQLKELDVEESDSDDDEDEVPLATLASKMDKLGTDTIVPETNGHANAAAHTQEPSAVDNFFGTPKQEPAQVIQPSTSIPGANAFDEAMGKIPSNPAAPSAPDFSFDSAFDDNFDFAAASEAENNLTLNSAPLNGNATAPITSFNNKDAFAPTTNGTTAPTLNVQTSQPSQPTPSSFDDIFSSQPSHGAISETPTTIQPPRNAGGTSFDEAFGGIQAAPKSGFSVSDSVSGFPPENPSQAFPTVSAPTSPKGSVASGRPSSPVPRQKSPAPHTMSPKQRPSTSSSREEREKPAVPQTRHSKLSIRLPFSKKKKTIDAAPPPPPSRSTLLTPPEEEPSRVMTPAVEDDVEAVKQLCGMGFSRTQAVGALEKYGYDVQKALNSLLGQ